MDCNQLTVASIQRDSLTALTGFPEPGISRCGGKRQVAFQNASKGATAYRWDFGVPNQTTDVSTDPSPVFQYPAAGRYDVTLVAYSDNCSDTARLQVALSDDPQPPVGFRVESSAPLCPKSRVELVDQTPGLPFGTLLQWRVDGATFLTPDTGTSVACSWAVSGVKNMLHFVVTPSGCIGAIRQPVIVQDGGIETSPDTTVLPQKQVELWAYRGSNFEWTGLLGASFVVGNTTSGPVAYPAQTGKAGRYLYLVEGIGENGCPDSDTVTVLVANRPYVFVPTAFTPNGDGQNDVLLPFLAGSNLREFAIFNRAGRRVFQTTSYTQGWDGQHAGEPAPVGVYYWLVRSLDEAGKELIKSGDVTLIR